MKAIRFSGEKIQKMKSSVRECVMPSTRACVHVPSNSIGSCRMIMVSRTSIVSSKKDIIISCVHINECIQFLSVRSLFKTPFHDDCPYLNDLRCRVTEITRHQLCNNTTTPEVPAESPITTGRMTDSQVFYYRRKDPSMNQQPRPF